MNKKINKPWSLAVLTAIGVSISVSMAAPSFAKDGPWIVEELKKVYYIPKPQLVVKLTKLAVDEANYDQLEVTVAYTKSSLQTQLSELKASYPGYELESLLISKSGNFRLVIPAVGLSREIEAKFGANGVSFHYEDLLSRAQSDALRSALNTSASSAVRLQGDVNAYVPGLKSMERVELPATICDRLVLDGSDFYQVVQAYAGEVAAIQQMKFTYASTQESLRKSLLETCVDLRQDTSVNSFKELLSVEVIKKSPKIGPFGETRKLVPNNQSVALEYSVAKDLR